MRTLVFSVTWLTICLAVAPTAWGQSDAEGHFKQAMAHYKREAYDEALNAIDRALQAQPKFPAAFVLKGQIYAAQQDYELAIKAYDTALKQDPKLYLARLHRGTARMHINDLDAALTDLNKYLAAIDTDPTGWVQRGMVRARLGMYKEAAEDLEHGLTIRPAMAEASFLLGMCYHQTGFPERGCAALRRALDLGYREAAAAIQQQCADR